MRVSVQPDQAACLYQLVSHCQSARNKEGGQRSTETLNNKTVHKQQSSEVPVSSLDTRRGQHLTMYSQSPP